MNGLHVGVAIRQRLIRRRHLSWLRAQSRLISIKGQPMLLIIGRWARRLILSLNVPRQQAHLGTENGQLLSSKYGILRAVRRFGWASAPRSFKVYPIAASLSHASTAHRVLMRPTWSADRLSGWQGIVPPSPFPARAVGGRPRQGRFGASAELR